MSNIYSDELMSSMQEVGLMFQMHHAYFAEEHEVVSIQKYEQSHKKYKKAFCDDHNEEILMKACAKCDKLICIECDTSTQDCTGEYSKIACAKVSVEHKTRIRLNMLLNFGSL